LSRKRDGYGNGVGKVLFIPVSIVGGIAAGFVGRKLFEQLWGVIDSEEPPDPKHRETTWVKLIAALALEGAIFRAVRGLFDHGARRGFARLTGAWPGEERPEPE
jgi:Protein of unknown function (DUF4235)